MRNVKVPEWIFDNEQRGSYFLAIKQKCDQLRQALEAAPHAKDCHSQREYHQPGHTHYETDAGEPCPAFHFTKGKCNCWRAQIASLTPSAEGEPQKP